MTFHNCTIGFDGSIQSRHIYDTAALESTAVQIFVDMLREHGPDFRQPMPLPGPPPTELYFSSVEGVALATFYAADELMSLSLLLSGRNESTADEALRHFLRMLGRLLPADRALNPLAKISERPVVLSFPWLTNRPADVEMMETCLAAAFFLHGS